MRSQSASDVTQHILHAFGLRGLTRLTISSAWGFAVISAALLHAAVPGSLLAQPTTVKVDSSSTGEPGQVDPQSAVAQASTPTIQERPGINSKVEEAAKKKGKPSVFGTVTKPGFFALVEQSSAWIFPRTGAAWGTGVARGSTFVGFGVSGNIKGSNDNLLSWSAQLGPQFVHEYSVPGTDQTPLRMDVSAFLSPLRGDDLNIYAIWRGVAGTDVADQRRFANTVRTGIVYSFAGSRIIPDAIEEINLPERGFYARVQPSWIFSTAGQLREVETQAYLGLAETWYPFTFAVEVGPQFIQTAGRELQTTLGSFFDFGYLISRKTRAYVRYRPGLSFGGNAYPAASQIFQAGINYRF
jgi:hypothetical protein